ncbi:prenylcysteine oxidase [Aplysia californica]|uniref:Prenylcysteine oxidase n=1 Tax=Aplysia californica TaxID=6500 RepID=A0ABM0K7Q5_APLCA|nr:prenylcysteine oxidase [Aplysia californica]
MAASWFSGQYVLSVVVLFLLLSSFPSSFDKVSCTEEDEMLPRIGIIGAGLSGTSSAYFLRQLFGKKATIDIFEAGKVGGRAAVININGLNYEAGASVIHKNNHYLVEFSQAFRKNTVRLSHSPGMVGLYGTDDILFQTSDWLAITLAKLVWRYGTDFYNIQSWTKNHIFPKFDRIYKFQDQGLSFTTVEDLLGAMGEDMLNMTKHSIKDVLLDAGLSQRFVDEFGMAAMRNNYGQTTDVHGFVGAVSMAGVEPGLWSVEGGNQRIAENLLWGSKATLVEAKVSTVALIKDELGTGSVSYEVEYEQSGKTNSREYDILILAMPLEGTKNEINFVDFPVKVTPFSQPFHKIVTMFVQGRINKTTFGLNSADDFPPDLFTINRDTFFNSIGKQSPVDSHQKPEKSPPSDYAVWKTFLNQVPSEEQVGKLFDKYEDLRFVDWMAYPEYKPNMDLPPFMLYDRLYYVNAIESAAAAMEMNVIGSKNVALLAFNQWQGNFDKIDELHLPSVSNDKSDL